jgi:hypothetical protein
MRRTLLIAALAAAASFSGAAHAQQWGDLTGKFVFDGNAPKQEPVNVNKDEQVFGKLGLKDESLLVGPGGGLANVVVYCRTADVMINPDLAANVPPKVVYDNKGGKFTPHVLTLWLGKQTLVLHNSDPVAHNSNLQPLGDTGVNPLLPPNSSQDHTFNRAQSIPAQVGCNIHPWMRGYVLPRPNPYATVSKEDGTFKIEKLPVGQLEFQAWQERMGYVDLPNNKPPMPRGRFTVTIKPGVNDLGVIKVDPKLVK